MAKNLSIATVIEKNRIASAVAFIPLLEIEVKHPRTGALVETIRVARNTEDITFEGKTWAKSAFDFDLKQEAGSQAELTVTIKDPSRAIQGRMQQYDGGVGFNVRLLVVNTANLGAGAEIEENFRVTGARAHNYVVTFTLGAENPLGLRFPRRKQLRDRCAWRYKSAECGYRGPLPTCSYTLQGPNGCAAHDNSIRFGGFPGLRMRQ